MHTYAYGRCFTGDIHHHQMHHGMSKIYQRRGDHIKVVLTLFSPPCLYVLSRYVFQLKHMSCIRIACQITEYPRGFEEGIWRTAMARTFSVHMKEKVTLWTLLEVTFLLAGIACVVFKLCSILKLRCRFVTISRDALNIAFHSRT